MSEFQGTPGPWFGRVDGSFKPTDWTAENDNAQVTTVAPITDKNGKTVALVVSEEWSDEGLDANAALIASAPDLLDCLQQLLWTRTQERGLQNAKPGESPLHDRCKAAIIKAGGRVL